MHHHLWRDAVVLVTDMVNAYKQSSALFKFKAVHVGVSADGSCWLPRTDIARLLQQPLGDGLRRDLENSMTAFNKIVQ